MTLRIGLVINPIAGLGGAVALKGTDGVVQQALERGATPQAELRTETALRELLDCQHQLQIFTASAQMGADVCAKLGFDHQVVYHYQGETSAEDTQRAVQTCIDEGVDILVFAGGDGTARDVLKVVPESQCCLGIPAGCKIHSGVYGVSPKATGALLRKLIEGSMLSLRAGDVMDIDEQAFRAGTVRARNFGEMSIPDDLSYVQAVKQGGRESDELVIADIAAEIDENMDPDTWYIIGSGGTTIGVMQELSLQCTLLGVDLIKDHTVVLNDLTANQLLEKISREKVKLLITPIGGQGHLFGRGNQQLSPELIKRVGRDNILVVASKTKLNSLHGRPLIVDTGDTLLDKELSGVIKVITGYRDYVMYRVSNPEYEVSDAPKLCKPC
nr:ATP-NAD kinase family protein [Aliagarivorans taiwanensis]